MSVKQDWHKMTLVAAIVLFCAIGALTYRDLLRTTMSSLSSVKPSYSSQIDLSENNEKWTKLLRKPAGADFPIAKPNGLFQVNLSTVGEVPENLNDGDLIEIEGTIIPSRDLASATVTWILFKGFEIQQGQTRATLFNLREGIPTTVSVILKKVGAGTSVVHLSLNAVVDNINWGGEASFSTENDLGSAQVKKEMKALQNELINSENITKPILQ